MRPTITMRTLVNNERASINVQLVSTKVINHLCLVECVYHATFSRKPDVHATNTRRGGVQDHELGVGVFGQLLRCLKNGFTILASQSALPDDHNRVHILRGVDLFIRQHLQRGAVIANISVFVSQIRLLANQTDHCAIQPSLTDTSIQDRCFSSRVRTNQLDHLRVIDVFDSRCANVAATFANRQIRPVNATLDVAVDHTFQGIHRFGRGQIACNRGNLFTFARGLNRGKSLSPSRWRQLPVNTYIRFVQTLATQSIPDETGFVGNPFLVHTIMVARNDPHDFTTFGIHTDVGAKRVHHINSLGFLQLPRAGRKSVRFRGQRPNRTKINDIALKVAIERAIQIGRNLCIFAAACLAHHGQTSDLGGETHATSAGNTACHRRGNERPEVQILNRPFSLAATRKINAICHGLILQVTLATLITNRAVEGMVQKHKLHNPFAGLLDHWRFCFNNRRLAFWPRTQVTYLHRAGRGRLRRTANNLDQTHAAVACDGQAFVITETRDFNARHFGRL